MKHRYTLSIFLFFVVTSLFSQEKHSAVEPSLSYVGDLGHTFLGGIARSTNAVGLATGSILVDTESAGWWKGGSFQLAAIATHGKGISRMSVGDQQVISNIEAGNYPFRLWSVQYLQQMGKWGVRVGLQNVSDEFMIQPFADGFSGSSFTVFPTLSINHSLANYPVAGLGMAVSRQFGTKFKWVSALYNGTVSDIETDNVNTKWQLNPNKEGLLWVSELSYRNGDKKDHMATQTASLGASVHTQKHKELASDKTHSSNYSIYGLASQQLYGEGKKQIGLFLQASYAPKDRNVATNYVGVGLEAAGFLTNSGKDKIGLALARLGYQVEDQDQHWKSFTESTIESYFSLEINQYLELKPTLFTIFSSANRATMVPMVRCLVTIF